jgi:hypothetical protein
MRENDNEDEPKVSIHGNVTMKLPVQLIYAKKNVFKKFFLSHLPEISSATLTSTVWK